MAWWQYVLGAWAILLVLFVLAGWRRTKVCDQIARNRRERIMNRARIPMRNRFLPPDEEPIRSDAMADQIVADQAIAHEEPGALVMDPEIKPEATTYYSLREVIGKFTFFIGKEGYMGISEALLDGTDSPVYEIPETWREPLIVAVFEVARLRHG